MIMVRAVVRPETSAAVMEALAVAGFPAVTRIEIFGRGKQRGIKVGQMLYDELPKEMLLLVVPEEAQGRVVEIILAKARTGEHGNPGDGKIFVSPVAAAYTISSGTEEL